MTRSYFSDSLKFEIDKVYKLSLIEFHTLGPLNLKYIYRNILITVS